MTVTVAEAGVTPFWLELGGSASGDGVSQAAAPAAVLETSVAVGGDGLPVVAYTEYPDATAAQGAIRVKRWTGSAWQTLDGGGVGQGYAPQVRISAAGAIYVAWLQDDVNGNTEIHLRVRMATTFDELGGSDSPGGVSGSNPAITAPFSLALDGAGNPLVAFPGLVRNGVTQVTRTPELIDGTAQVYVRHWTGSAWQFVGSDFTGGGASNAVSFLNAAGAAVFHDSEAPSLAVDATGAPVVAFTYFTSVGLTPHPNSDVYVTRWNGTAWTPVGPAVPAGDTPAGNGAPGGVSNSATGSFNPSLAADASGQLALAWKEDATEGVTYVWVRVWNGATWAELAGSATGSGFIQGGTLNLFPQVALDAAGRPVVAWRALSVPSAPSQVFVVRWNGSDAWVELGLDSAKNAGISDARLDVMAPSLALTPSGGSAPAGVPTVGWLDVRATGFGQLYLRQHDAGATALALTRHSLTVTNRPTGSVVNAQPLPGGATISCGNGTSACAGTFDFGTPVVLQATPVAGFAFVSWTGVTCAAGATNATCAFTLRANVTVTPNYRARTQVTVVKAGNGAGVVTGLGISCGLDCGQPAFDGKPVKLTAAPAIGSNFLGFSGACVSATTTCTFVPAGNSQTVNATFQLQKRRLHVTVVGNGSVTGANLTCDPTTTPCAVDYDHGTRVPLTPVAPAGHRFVGWSGSCVGAAGCTAVMTLTRSVTATFRPVFTLTVTKSGNSNGTITGPGIKCGTDCTHDFLNGTIVTLTRSVPITGTVFRWLGDCAFRGAAATCSLAMTANRSVGAEYKLRPLALTVVKVGPQFGTVSGAAGAVNVNCGGACADVVDYGTLVTLLATPTTNPASEFVAWTGCAPAASLSCSFTMTTNRTVKATFRPQVSTVAVQSAGAPLVVGGRRQLIAMATFTDGSVEDVTARAIWVSSNPAKVSIVRTTGLVTGLALGSANITATFRAVPSAPVVVQVDTLNSIAVSCQPYGDSTGDPKRLACLPSGRRFEVHCRALGRFAGNPGLDVDITTQVGWFSTDTLRARSTGLVAFSGPVRQSFRILAPGVARLFARFGALASPTAGVLGTHPWIVQGAAQTPSGPPQIAPDPASVNVGSRVQLQAITTLTGSGACAVPPPRDFALLVAWGSSNDLVADVSFFGQVTGVSPGSATITATYGIMLPDSSTVTVH